MNVYQENIIEHYRNPQNTGEPATFTHTARFQNLSCGDEIEVFITMEDGKVSDIKYLAEGCAISIAAASMLSDELKEVDRSKLLQLDERYVLDLLGIELTTSRIKCAHLPLEAIQQAVSTSPDDK